MAFRRIYLFLTEEEITRKTIEKWVNKARGIKNLKEIQENGLEEKHIMGIHILKIMSDNNLTLFINRLTSFILKWGDMYDESSSNSLTKIIDFFFQQI